MLDGGGRKAGGLGKFGPSLDYSGDLGVDGVEITAGDAGVGCHGREGGLVRRRPKGIW